MKNTAVVVKWSTTREAMLSVKVSATRKSLEKLQTYFTRNQQFAFVKTH